MSLYLSISDADLLSAIDRMKFDSSQAENVREDFQFQIGRGRFGGAGI